VLALSSAGFTPGVPVDARFIQLVPDIVTLLSLSGGLFPLLQGNIGVLDANDRGTATLDLSAFSGLTGLPLWAAAITLAPGAPSGILTIGKPIIVVLD